MISQLVIGSLLIVLTITIHAGFMAFAIRVLRQSRDWFSRPPYFGKSMVALGSVSLWLLLGMTVTVWIWAIYFYATGALKDMETSVYFALVSFTTLGFGDIILVKEHRLLSGLLAANGLIHFGLTTAFLIEYMQRLYRSQSRATDT